MRKLAMLLMVFSFILAACGGSKAAKPGTDTKKTGEKKVAVKTDDVKVIYGTWEGEELGDVLAQYGMTTPAKFVFNADGTYMYQFTKSGTLVEMRGTFKMVDTSKKPWKIDLVQTEAGVPGKLAKKSMDSAGIIGVGEDGKLKIIVYNKKFLPRPEEFGDTDTQVFRKVK